MRALVLAMLALLVALTLWSRARPGLPSLINFEQADPKRLELTFEGYRSEILALQFSQVPLRLDENSEMGRASTLTNAKGQVTWTLDEPSSLGEYSVFLFFGDAPCNQAVQQGRLAPAIKACANYIELIRQPAAWLERKFGFRRELGYTTLGRRSLRISASESNRQHRDKQLTFTKGASRELEVGTGALDPRIPHDLSPAAHLIRTLWAMAPLTGPTQLPYGEFVALKLQEKLDRLSADRFQLQCQGFRDLYLHAALSEPGLKVRAVEAYNYGPAFPALITHGHSLAETWVDSLGKWVLTDPWLGVFLSDSKGHLLSVEDVVSQRERPENIQVVAIIDRIERRTRGDGGDERLLLKPSELKLTEFTRSENGSSPGYLFYFGSVVYRTVELSERP